MRGVKYVAGVMCSLCLCFALFVSCVESVVFNMDFYRTQFAKLNTPAASGLEQTDLEEAVTVLIDYIQGKRDNMDMQAKVYGFDQEVFNEREKAHMVDVQNLYLAFSAARVAAWVGFTVFLAMLIVLSRRDSLRVLERSYLFTLLGIMAVLAAIGIVAATDFGAFWTSFHHLFFSNNLWVLDPTVDIMIRIVPGDFFSAVIGAVLLRLISSLVALAALAGVGLWLGSKRKRRLGHAV